MDRTRRTHYAVANGFRCPYGFFPNVSFRRRHERQGRSVLARITVRGRLYAYGFHDVRTVEENL